MSGCKCHQYLGFQDAGISDDHHDYDYLDHCDHHDIRQRVHPKSGSTLRQLQRGYQAL